MEEAMFASCYGKALGLLKALHWMIDGGHSNVIFELNYYSLLGDMLMLQLELGKWVWASNPPVKLTTYMSEALRQCNGKVASLCPVGHGFKCWKQPLCILGDNRSSRSSLVDGFDSLEEGGLRASSSYSREINEHDNDKAIESLEDRVSFLKRLTGDIHEEVESHNQLLDRVDAWILYTWVNRVLLKDLMF
ncbi:hypothetical protein JHK85_056710 [Glycine max]|nr:hypothetical protein JHK85_056710 [Glycine max]